MATDSAAMGIDEYLRDRLMPVEGAIPHLPGIDMHGDSIPTDIAGGDLFEYINFQQRYDIDTRIRNALRLSEEILRPKPPDAADCTTVDDSIAWLKTRPGYRPELEAAYREVRSLEQL